MEGVQSLNTQVDLVTSGTSYLGLPAYGQLMIGDKSFEFYADKNRQNYIQIPWEEVDYVTASVWFKGRWIPRITFWTHNNGSFSFAAKDPKGVLRAINNYIPKDRMRHALTAVQVIKRAFKSWLGS